jgi:hypothetical protein
MAEYLKQRVMVHVRPENASIRPTKDDDAELSPAETQLVTEAVLPAGSHTYVHLHLGGPYKPFVVRDPTNRLTKREIGRNVALHIDRLGVYSSETGYLLGEYA